MSVTQESRCRHGVIASATPSGHTSVAESPKSLRHRFRDRPAESSHFRRQVVAVLLPTATFEPELPKCTARVIIVVHSCDCRAGAAEEYSHTRLMLQNCHIRARAAEVYFEC